MTISDPMVERTFREELEEAGFKCSSIDRFVRLMKGEPTEDERARWEEVGILDGDKLVVSEEEAEDKTVITFALWDLMYDGMIERIKGEDGYLYGKMKA